MVHILLIDDDADLGVMLADVFAREGIHLTAVETGRAGLNAAIDGNYSLILLDIMLPEIDGLQVLKQLRQAGNETLVIMLTARGDDVDRVIGLELGADDYLAKPFYPRELVARVKALLRRNTKVSNAAVLETLRFAGFELDVVNAEATCDGKKLSLTPTEFEVLRQLVIHHGQLVTKESLSSQVLGRQLGPFDRSLDVHISNVRKKLPTHPDRIQTVRGRGYRVVSPDCLVP